MVAIVIALGVGAAVMMSKNNNEATPSGAMMAEPTDIMTAEPTTGSATDEAMVADVEGVKVVTVTGSNFKFDPVEIRVKKGDTVRVLFKSNGEFPHDFVIDEYEVATNQLNAGEEEEVEFVADQAGTFEYYCSVGNHRAMGMVGKLIVE